MASDGTWQYRFSEEENARLNLEPLDREHPTAGLGMRCTSILALLAEA